MTEKEKKITNINTPAIPYGDMSIDEFFQKIYEAFEELGQYRAIGTVKGYECAIQSSIENYNLYREYKEKLQEFKEIGTVEELKALKERNDWRDMEMYGLGYNQGTIDRADELQKCREQGYNKAIDEFAERLKVKAEEILKNPDVMSECKKCTIWSVRDIDEIAEQLKGGAE